VGKSSWATAYQGPDSPLLYNEHGLPAWHSCFRRSRALADKLGGQLGTTVIVENKAGAGGTAAAFAGLIRAEYDNNRDIIRQAGIKLE